MLIKSKRCQSDIVQVVVSQTLVEKHLLTQKLKIISKNDADRSYQRIPTTGNIKY